jgi:hypothetical protein
MDEQIRRDEAQVMFDIFENWPTTASTRRAMQQHILGLQIKLDAAIAAAQPVPAEGAQAAQFALERDRTKVAECVTRLKHTLENYHWLIEGRGSYEWDDDRWHQEFKTVCELLQKDLEPMVRIAADWSNCPTKWEDVQAARAAPPATAAPAGYPKPTKPAE